MRCSETGRSILEIMAIMAVICLISIGSVKGYQSAKRKHDCNELISKVNEQAIATSQQMTLGKELEEIDLGFLFSEGRNPPASSGQSGTESGEGRTILNRNSRRVILTKTPIKVNDDFFKLPIVGLDEESCHQLESAAGGAIRRVDCQKEGDSYYTADVIFQKDLSLTDGILPSKTSNTSDYFGSGAGNSTTRIYDDDQESCEAENYQYCANNTCITKEETCPSGSAKCSEFPGTSEHSSGGYAGTTGTITCYCPEGKVYQPNDEKCITVCSGHGTITSDDECECKTGYTGIVCETECSNNGKVIDDKCVCNKGFMGEICDIQINCGQHGSLNDDNTCTCDNGYYSNERTCKKCPDENAITCNNDGVSDTCKKKYFLNEEHVCITCPYDYMMQKEGTTSCYVCPQNECAEGDTLCIRLNECTKRFYDALPLKSDDTFDDQIRYCSSICGENKYARYTGTKGVDEPWTLRLGVMKANACATITSPVSVDSKTDAQLLASYNNLRTRKDFNSPFGDSNIVAIFGDNPTASEIRSKLKQILTNDYIIPPTSAKGYWLDAEAWCLAHNAKLIPYEDYFKNNNALKIATFFFIPGNGGSNDSVYWARELGKTDVHCASATNPTARATRSQCHGAHSFPNYLHFLCKRD